MRRVQVVGILASVTGLVSVALAQCEPDRLLSPPSWRSTDYGLTVAMTDGRVIVGDSRGSDGLASGVVHMYTLDDGVWTLEQSIRPADARFGDGFGFHVATDGERIIVGAIRADLVGGIAAGAAYVFDFDGTRWVETGRLIPPEPIAWSSFGGRVSILGDVAVVKQSEIVYVFEQSTEGWQLTDRVLAPDATGERQGFGVALHLSPDWMFVGGARGSRDRAKHGSGVRLSPQRRRDRIHAKDRAR